MIAVASAQGPGLGFPNFGFPGSGQNPSGGLPNFNFPIFGGSQQPQQPQQTQQPGTPGTLNPQLQQSSVTGGGQQQFNPFVAFHPTNLFNQFQNSGFGYPFGQSSQTPNAYPNNQLTPQQNIQPNPQPQQPQTNQPPSQTSQSSQPTISANVNNLGGDAVEDGSLDILIDDIFTKPSSMK